MEAIEGGWHLEFGAGFIVPPCRGKTADEIAASIIGGAVEIPQLPLPILMPLFLTDETRLSSRIAFTPENGEQTNAIRSDLLAIAFGSAEEKIASATSLAIRLASVSRKQSRNGLLLFLCGVGQEQKRVAMWKFPAENTLQAQLNPKQNLISHVENAFSTESGYLKSAFFQGTNTGASFWSGRAEDRQARSSLLQIADFWLREFLQAQPETTDSYQTRLLAKSARSALSSTSDVDIKTALVSALQVLRARGNRRISLADFSRNFLPQNARTIFENQIPDGTSRDVLFRIDHEVLSNLTRYQNLSLENGVIVSGPSETFDNDVAIQEIDGGRIRISVEGVLASRDIKSRT